MIEQQATVTQCDDKTVWLQAERQSTCSGCAVKQGCGTGLLANHVGKRFSQISVDKTSEVHVGEQVQLAIPEQTLLQGAVLMYILPLALLFIFAMIAKLANLSEFVEIFAGLSGLFIGFYIVRRQIETGKQAVKAEIVKSIEEQQ